MAIASNFVTYSAAYTLVPTYECFNRCTYCNFRTDPGQSPWLSLSDAERVLRSLRSQDSPHATPPLTMVAGQPHTIPVIEILILSGEVHPHSSQRREWIQRVYDLCELALALDFLPHTNVGPLSYAEMDRLKTVNVSMGLMLEQLTPTLLQTVHRHAPSKVPAVRLQQLAWAGELQIPFTTGLLLGIGETEDDRRITLEAIAQIHQQWGHIQEVILQPYNPGRTESWAGESFAGSKLVEVVRLARRILPDEIAIQIPPNLVQTPSVLLACLEAGARDLGGIGPRDEVNPDYPHPLHGALVQTLATENWSLVPRLPIYPQYDVWLAPPLQRLVQVQRSRLELFPHPQPQTY